MQAQKSGKGYQIGKYAEVPTPEAAVSGGLIMPGPALAEALKALVKQLDGTTHNAVVALPGQLALVRRIPMPKLPLKRLRSLIEAQGAQFIPFFRDGATFDLLIVNPNLSPTEQEILLVAVPTTTVERLQAVLRMAGLKLVGLEVETVALYRAGLALGLIPSGAPAAVLDVGHRRAKLGLFSGGWPTLTRTLDVLPLAASPAEAPPEARFVSPDEFAVEVRRTMEILLSQSRPDEAVTSLMLSARWQMPEMSSMLQEELRQGGRVASDFQVTAIGGSIVPGYALAFGLSLADTVPPVRLKLLPRPTQDIQKQRRGAVLALVAVMAISGAYGWYWHQESGRIKTERTRLTAAIANHDTYIKTTGPVVSALEARRKELEPYEAVLSTTVKWSSFYPHLRSLLPQGVVLYGVALHGDGLAITGKADTPEALAEFVQNLHTSPMINPPTLHTFSQQGGAFSITGKVKLGVGGGKK